MPSYPNLIELNEVLKFVGSTDVSQLLQNPKWGAFDFTSCERVLRRIVTVVQLLNKCDLNIIPDQQLNTMRNALSSIREQINEIKEFSVTNGDLTQARRVIEEQLEQHCASLVNTCGLYLPVAVLSAVESQRVLSELSGIKTTAEQLLDDLEGYSSGKKKEIDAAIESARQAAGRAGVEVFSRDFEKQADAHIKASYGWLSATALFALLTIGVALLSWFKYQPSLNTSMEAASWITTKLVVLGILFAAVMWCGRLYKSEKHQAALCLHRQHALTTFQAFVSNARDEATKDAVLLAATQSIFALASPGYLGGDDGSVDNGVKIVELVKAVMPGAKA